MNIRNSYNKLLLAVGIVGILDTILIIFLGNPPNVGIIFPSIIGIMCILEYIYRKKNKTILFLKKDKSFIKKVILFLSIIFLISFIVIVGLILISINDYEINSEIDFVIILGGGIKDNNEVSESLGYRLDAGADYLNKNPEKKVIVSGGYGFNQNVSEAFLMEKYLINRGISKDRIIKEEKSTSTMENFLFSKELIEKNYDNKKPEVLIITNNFHMFRSKMLARRNGFEVYGMSTDTYLLTLPNSIIREYLAMIKSFLFDVAK